MATGNNLYNPFGNAGGWSNSAYGEQRGTKQHMGVDYTGVPNGTPIQAATGGQVIFSGYTPSTGWTVVVKDSEGYGHVYGHMGLRSVNNNADTRPAGMAEVGQTIAAGNVVGPVGNTGYIITQRTGADAGTHLHYTVISAQDPEWIKAVEKAGENNATNLGVNLNKDTTLDPHTYAEQHPSLYDRAQVAQSAPGHWEDTTQYDPQGNVVSSNGRIWVSDTAPLAATDKVSAPGKPPVTSALATPQPARPPGAAGDAVDSELPDGTRIVSTTSTKNGVTTEISILLSQNGVPLLSAGPGQTLERDPETGVVSVRTKDSDIVQTYDPRTYASGDEQPAAQQQATEAAKPDVQPQAQPQTLPADLNDAQATQLKQDLGLAPATQAPGHPDIRLADADDGVMTDGGKVTGYDEGTLSSKAAEASAATTFAAAIPTPSVIAATAYAHGVMSALNLMQALQNHNDLSAALNAAGLANVVGNTVGSGPIVAQEYSGSLGALSSTLNFLDSVEHGNTLGALSSGLSTGSWAANALAEHFADAAMEAATETSMDLAAETAAMELGAASSAMSSALPFVGMAMAMQSGNSISMMAAAANFIPVYGPFISIGISLLAAAGVFGGNETPPPPRGEVHFAWDGLDADGHPHTAIQTDANISGGAQAASQIAEHLLHNLQTMVEQANAQTLRNHPDTEASQLLALNPNLLPSVCYDQNQISLTLPNPDGATSFFVNLEDDNAMSQVLQLLHDNGGLAPRWMVDTQGERYAQLLQEGASAASIERELTAGKSGLTEQGWSQAAAIQGSAGEAADFKSQQFGSLVVHARDAQVRLSQTLSNLDHDAYAEQTQWVAARDASGQAQAMLIIDFNNDGMVDSRDVLNLGGNRGQIGAREAQLQGEYADLQRNNVQWLDANRDGVLDNGDPAFAAIRLFMDSSQDARIQGGEAQSLAQAGVTAIDLRSGEVRYADGHSDALSAQLLSGDTSGVKLTKVYEAMEGRLVDQHAGDVLEHEGYQGRTADGEAIREQTFEQEAVRTGDWEGTAEQDAHRHGGANVGGAPTQTDASGAQSLGEVKTQAAATTQRTVTASQVQVRAQAGNAAAERVVFVPVGNPQEVRDVTAGMIRSLQENTPGGLGLDIGVLAAVAVGSTAAAGEPASAIPASSASVASEPAGRVVATMSAAPTSLTTQSSAGLVQVTVVQPLPLKTEVQQAWASVLPSVLPAHVRPAGSDSETAMQEMPMLARPAATAAASALSSGRVYQAAVVKTAEPPEDADLPAAPAAAPASAPSVVLIDCPVVRGETIPGTEDVVFRIPGPLLAANDSTPNAVADPSRPALNVTSVGDAAHGVVSLIDDVVVFTPDANYHGTASFSYTVTDQYGLSHTATATLEIAAVNDVPQTRGETTANDEDVGLLFTQAQLLANDSDPDTVTDGQVLSISRVGDATHGTVSLDGSGNIRYVPEANYNGAAQFTYWVNDGQGGETAATVNINIAPVNDAPVVQGEQVDSDEDVVLRFAPADLLANDSDVDTATNGQVMSISDIGNARHGSVQWITLDDGRRVIEFTTEANYHGLAAYDYTVDDGNGGQVTTTVVLNLAAVNDAPQAHGGEEVSSDEDQSILIEAAGLLANDTDPDVATDGQSISLSRVGNAMHGTVNLNANGDVVFTPDTDYNGDATFDYWVKDSSGTESQGATVALHIAPVNDAPAAQGEEVSGASEDAVFHIQVGTLLANDSDIDDVHGALRLGWVGNATGGTVSLDAAGNVVFTPVANFNGYACFSYAVRDAAGLESPAALARIPVIAVNDAPLGVDDQFATYRNSTMSIDFAQLTGNDSDMEHDALTVSAVRAGGHGEVTIVDGKVRFVPTAGFAGTASFDYQVDDGQGGQTWATAYVSVTVPPQYPTANITLGSNWVDVWHGDAANLRQTFYYSFNDENPSTVTMGIAPNFGNAFTYAGFGNVQWFTPTEFNIYKYDVYGNANISLNLNLTDESGLSNIAHVYVRYDAGAWLNPTISVTQFSVWHDHTGYATPIVLDLEGAGLQEKKIQDSNVLFDVNGDGAADRMAWVGAGNGVLAWDSDRDGHISGANEFSFKQYVEGAQTDMQGLAAFDSNHDGRLDAGDAEFTRFGVWQDRNGDGVQGTGEFQTLAQRGIQSLCLHSDGQIQGQGSEVTSMGTAQFTRTDGSTGTAYDAAFAYQDSADAQMAETVRQALLFNQLCNTATAQDSAPLGFVPMGAADELGQLTLEAQSWSDLPVQIQTPQTASQQNHIT